MPAQNQKSAYTSLLRKPLSAIDWEDDNFIEELLEVARLFRSFSDAMTEFIAERGYAGDLSDSESKAAFVRFAFLKADMDPPREIREWFAGQPVRRETAFQICFAFSLDGSQTDDFFQRVYARERSFNCHDPREAVYYFCLNHGLAWPEAQEILSLIPPPGKDGGRADPVHTGDILKELNRLETKEELIAWLTENIHCFSGSSVTARETIRRLWDAAAGPRGLLVRERNALPSLLDDPATGRKNPLRAGAEGLKTWDAYLAILQLDRKEVARLDTDRSVRPILARLHDGARDSFPDRQGIDRILRGEHVSYERVRKWLVLLAFYAFWARKAIDGRSYAASPGDAERCIASMNQHLYDSGYPELYVGNPYDWIFFYAAKNPEPLPVFRFIWNELLAGALEHRQTQTASRMD